MEVNSHTAEMVEAAVSKRALVRCGVIQVVAVQGDFSAGNLKATH
ncbi:hypothetical protein AADZ90_020420 [Aestuariibius sp. 2305UL40-4]